MNAQWISLITDSAGGDLHRTTVDISHTNGGCYRERVYLQYIVDVEEYPTVYKSRDQYQNHLMITSKRIKATYRWLMQKRKRDDKTSRYGATSSCN